MWRRCLYEPLFQLNGKFQPETRSAKYAWDETARNHCTPDAAAGVHSTTLPARPATLPPPSSGCGVRTRYGYRLRACLRRGQPDRGSWSFPLPPNQGFLSRLDIPSPRAHGAAADSRGDRNRTCLSRRGGGLPPGQQRLVAGKPCRFQTIRWWIPRPGTRPGTCFPPGRLSCLRLTHGQHGLRHRPARQTAAAPPHFTVYRLQHGLPGLRDPADAGGVHPRIPRGAQRRRQLGGNGPGCAVSRSPLSPIRIPRGPGTGPTAGTRL